LLRGVPVGALAGPARAASGGVPNGRQSGSKTRLHQLPDFLIECGSSLACAEEPKIPRVGILSPADSDKTPIFDAFREGLRDLGWVEGRNIILEFRLARGDFTLFPRFAAELVSLPVDVIVSDGGLDVLARAARTIPIVAMMGDRSHRTRRWREPDSNSRSRRKGRPFRSAPNGFCTPSTRRGGSTAPGPGRP
jgi:hypothetical protein